MFCYTLLQVGITKKKQRFRKGKLVMILSKEINDNEEDEKPQHCDSSEVTERTSLGRSVRCGFRSYSEKFLAEQEAAKRSTLLQLTNGAGAAADGAANNNLLPLTNGDALGAVDEDSLESSGTSMGGSDRKGVYGGGVRYFTTDDDEYESHSSDDEDGDDSNDDEEEDNEAEEELDENRGIHQEDDEEEMQEIEGSMGSMFTDEDIYRDTRSAGVDSMSASSTLTSGYPEPKPEPSQERKEKDRDPPQGLTPIDDDSMVS